MSRSALAELIERTTSAKRPADLSSTPSLMRLNGAPTVGFEALLMLGSVDSVMSMEHDGDPLAADIVVAMANISNCTSVTEAGRLVCAEPLVARKYAALLVAGSTTAVDLTQKRFLSVRWPTYESLGAVCLRSKAAVAGACVAIARTAWNSNMDEPEFVLSYRVASRLWQEGMERAERESGSRIPFATWQRQMVDQSQCLAAFRDTLPSAC
ncbi:MAG: hypothetical protein IT432_12185 [Phycisphaerales bacterium]|nr:hypothetical protein [Phycisphaerales bacterium]